MLKFNFTTLPFFRIYSGNVFDLESATINGVVYTALDPSIFEIKFPNSDIKGSVVGDNTGLGA